MKPKKTYPTSTAPTSGTEPLKPEVSWQDKIQKSNPMTQEVSEEIALKLLSLEILQKFLSEGKIAYENTKINGTPYRDAPTIHWQPSNLFLRKLKENKLDDTELLKNVMNTLIDNVSDILYRNYGGKTDEDFEIIMASFGTYKGQVKFSLHFPNALDPRDVLQKLRNPKVAQSLEAAIKNDFHQTTRYADFFDNLNNQTPDGYGRA